MRKPYIVLALLLGACGAHTSVQGGYNGDRDSCQEVSVLKLPLFLDESEPISMKERNAKLVTLFSDCMFERGWTVATPTRAGNAGFRADPGVGVGASVRPGRFSDDALAAKPVSADPSPLAPQNQGVFEETREGFAPIEGSPGVVRKVPVENVP